MTKRRIYVDQLAGGKSMLAINKAAELFMKGEAELVFYTMEFSEKELRRRFESVLGKEQKSDQSP